MLTVRRIDGKDVAVDADGNIVRWQDIPLNRASEVLVAHFLETLEHAIKRASYRIPKRLDAPTKPNRL